MVSNERNTSSVRRRNESSSIWQIKEKTSYYIYFSSIFRIVQSNGSQKPRRARIFGENNKRKYFITDGLFLIFISYIFSECSNIETIENDGNNSNCFLYFENLYSNDYKKIKGISIGCISEKLNNGRSYFNTSITVSDCFFSRLSMYSGFGGVIFVSGGSYSMNISNSMFFMCNCSNDGGAIYFNSFSSILKMICACRCSCGTHCHFGWLQASNENYVEYLSIVLCSINPLGWYSILLLYGRQTVDNTNCSMNTVQYISGIGIVRPSSFTCSLCTFSNNNASEYRCIYFYNNSGTMTFTNIVHNNSPTNNGVVLVVKGSPKIEYCVFDKNQNTLFNVYEGSLEVSHSFISHMGTSFSIGLSILMENNNSIDTSTDLISRQTYQFIFFKSYYCHTETPEITFYEYPNPSKAETPKKTTMNTVFKTSEIQIKETPYRSYESCIYTCEIAIWREIRTVFINFCGFPLILINLILM